MEHHANFFHLTLISIFLVHPLKIRQTCFGKDSECIFLLHILTLVSIFSFQFVHEGFIGLFFGRGFEQMFAEKNVFRKAYVMCKEYFVFFLPLCF